MDAWKFFMVSDLAQMADLKLETELNECLDFVTSN